MNLVLFEMFSLATRDIWQICKIRLILFVVSSQQGGTVSYDIQYFSLSRISNDTTNSIIFQRWHVTKLNFLKTLIVLSMYFFLFVDLHLYVIFKSSETRGHKMPEYRLYFITLPFFPE